MVWQVSFNNRLPRKRHPRPGQIVSLYEWMCHKTGLRSPGTVTKSEHDNRQVIVADKTRNPVINNRHRKESRCTFFRLHTAGGNKADNGQPLLGTLNQEVTEPRAIRVIDAASLEGNVGNDHPYPVTGIIGLEVTDARNQTMRPDILVQCRFDRRPEGRKRTGVRRHQGFAEFLKVLHITVENRIDIHPPGTILCIEEFIEKKIAIGDGQPVPEILTPPDPHRLDTAFKSLACSP